MCCIFFCQCEKGRISSVVDGFLPYFGIVETHASLSPATKEGVEREHEYEEKVLFRHLGSYFVFADCTLFSRGI